MFKISNELTPENKNEIFTNRQPVNLGGNESQILRSMTSWNFVLPKSNTELYRGRLAFSGPVIWICLTDSIKSTPSTEGFHNRCIE